MAQKKTIQEYDAENSASPEVFSRAINYVRENYKSKSFGLLVFSHASGWLPQGALNNPRTISRSIIADGNREMDIKDFAAAIPDNFFDNIVFEVCLMANIEVAYELRHKTKAILASSAEILSPGFTSIYNPAINKLMSSPTDIVGFGQTSFKHYDEQADNGQSRSATFSVIKTSELENLAMFIKENCDFSKAVNIADYQHFDRNNWYRLFFDFEQYYASLMPESKRGEFSDLVRKTVLWKANTPTFILSGGGFEIKHHSGMTTYIPQSRFPFLNSEYQKLQWYEAITK